MSTHGQHIYGTITTSAARSNAHLELTLTNLNAEIDSAIAKLIMLKAEKLRLLG